MLDKLLYLFIIKLALTEFNPVSSLQCQSSTKKDESIDVEWKNYPQNSSCYYTLKDAEIVLVKIRKLNIESEGNPTTNITINNVSVSHNAEGQMYKENTCFNFYDKFVCEELEPIGCEIRPFHKSLHFKHQATDSNPWPDNEFKYKFLATTCNNKLTTAVPMQQSTTEVESNTTMANTTGSVHTGSSTTSTFSNNSGGITITILVVIILLLILFISTAGAAITWYVRKRKLHKPVTAEVTGQDMGQVAPVAVAQLGDATESNDNTYMEITQDMRVNELYGMSIETDM